MFRKRNVLNKSQRMGIVATILALVLVFNPVLAFAEEGDDIVLFSSDGTETTIGSGSSDNGSEGDKKTGTTGSRTTTTTAGIGGVIGVGSDQGSADGAATDIMLDDEIWALVDKEELRSLVDADKLANTIDVVALLDGIDRDELKKTIDGKELLSAIDEEILKEEFIERKLEGETFVIDDDGTARIVTGDEAKELEEKRLKDKKAEVKASEGSKDEENEASEDKPVEESSEDNKLSVNKKGENEEKTDETSDNDSVLGKTEETKEEEEKSYSGLLMDISESDAAADVVSVTVPVDGYEGEEGYETKEFSLSEHPVDVANIQLPVIGEKSPFDFIIDPMNLVYETNASGYGGGEVEEGANVLFRNSEGEYAFSHKSDMLKVVNKGNVPIKLVITASVKNSENVEFVGSASELTGENPSVFMALSDEGGVRSVITDKGEAVIETVVKPVPDSAYVYKWNSETRTYEYEFAEGQEDIEFDSFSFGLIADCNKEANWSKAGGYPSINVSWKADAIMTDWEEITAELEAYERAKLLAETEEFEAFKLVKTQELVEEKLIDLLQEKLEELKKAELEKLIEVEMRKLASEELFASDKEGKALDGDAIDEIKELKEAEDAKAEDKSSDKSDTSEKDEESGASKPGNKNSGADDDSTVISESGNSEEPTVIFESTD